MVKLSGEREEGNHILRSPCSLLVVGGCVGCGCVIGFGYMVVVWVGFSCGFCLFHVLQYIYRLKVWVVIVERIILMLLFTNRYRDFESSEGVPVRITFGAPRYRLPYRLEYKPYHRILSERPRRRHKKR